MSDSEDEKRGPLDVTFKDFTPEHEAGLRLLNSVVFPIRYSVRVCVTPFLPSPPFFRCSEVKKGTQKSNNSLSHPSSSSLSLLPNKQDKFYMECAAAGRVTQLAYIGTELVGAIACRLELLPDRSGARMYIMTVGVLAREKGGEGGVFFVWFFLGYCAGKRCYI